MDLTLSSKLYINIEQNPFLSKGQITFLIHFKCWLLQVKLEKLEYRAQVHLFQYFNLKGVNNIVKTFSQYSNFEFISCKP